MPTEDHSSDHSHQGLPQGGGVDLSLDELAKGLATGTLSRGKALRLMGAALVGGALASIPGIAWAKPNKPAGAKCNHNHQCASGQCVDSRVGRVCTAPAPPPPICTPSCPANCSCDFAADGTTTCIDCPPETLCPELISEGTCEEVCAPRGLVCLAGAPPGFAVCAPPCTGA
jgi:hypothetical protein